MKINLQAIKVQLFPKLHHFFQCFECIIIETKSPFLSCHRYNVDGFVITQCSIKAFLHEKKTKDATFQSLSKPHFLNINVQIFFMEIGKILYLTDLLLTQDFFFVNAFEVDDTGKKVLMHLLLFFFHTDAKIN